MKTPGPSIHFLGDVDREAAGSAMYNHDLVTSLAQRGARFTIVGSSVAGDVEQLVRAVHRVEKSPRRDARVLWRISSYLDMLNYQRELARVDIEEPDLIIVCDLLLFSHYRKRFPRVPLIYLPHSLVAPVEVGDSCVPGFSRWFLTRLYRSRQVRCLNESALTVRFTRAGCDALKEYYGDTIRPRFLVNPIGVSDGEASVEADRAENQPIRLLFVGRLVESKNVSKLVEALSQLTGTPSWTLDVVGRGDQLEALTSLVNRLGLQEKVRFRGFQEDVGRWYRQADLVVSVSALESLNLPLVESMSHGIPVVTASSREEGFFTVSDEIVDDGETGYVVRNLEEFKARVAELMLDPDKRRRMGLRAREHVRTNLKWSHHVTRWLDAIESVLRPSSAVMFSEERVHA